MCRIYQTDDFAIEVIAKGAFVDDDPGFLTHRFLVETFVFRANHTALNEYILQTIATNDRYVYETEEEYQEYKREKEKNRESWEKRIAALLDIAEPSSFSVTRSLSEIFTAVAMWRIPKSDVKEGDKTHD